MPKVSDEHKTRRREQILEGAQRAFARHGYEGATVAMFEEETGLSRGAIFNYFPNKQAIFIELAARSSDRLTEIWLEQGFRALLDAIVHEDFDWLAVQLEAVRRLRTDEDFRRRLEEHDAAHRAERMERLERMQAPGYREDVALEAIAMFLGTVANGLALRATVGDPLPDLDVLADLVERGVSAGPRKRTTPRR
jgi:TetR/AcrR family transcriptional regulator, transcriptional repressor of aconitase